MHIPRLYLDSSVIGGYFDDEFQQSTRELWKQMERGYFQFYTSPVVLDEIANAPSNVRDLLALTFHDALRLLDLDEEVAQLAKDYISHKTVPEGYADDAVHVAIAVVHRMDYLVSWNFKHLVNVRRSDAFNSVNLLQGYPSVRIVSPLELIYGSE